MEFTSADPIDLKIFISFEFFASFQKLIASFRQILTKMKLFANFEPIFDKLDQFFDIFFSQSLIFFYLPGRITAGSIISGLLVAPMMKTFFLHPCCPFLQNLVDYSVCSSSCISSA